MRRRRPAAWLGARSETATTAPAWVAPPSSYLQEKHGIRAAKVQMGMDFCVVLLALFVVPPGRVGLVGAGGGADEPVLWVNHKLDGRR
jgi:hypothetical protein